MWIMLQSAFNSGILFRYSDIHYNHDNFLLSLIVCLFNQFYMVWNHDHKCKKKPINFHRKLEQFCVPTNATWIGQVFWEILVILQNKITKSIMLLCPEVFGGYCWTNVVQHARTHNKLKTTALRTHGSSQVLVYTYILLHSQYTHYIRVLV